MTAAPRLLDSSQMAHFVARGFLRFDGVVPAAINAALLDAFAEPPPTRDVTRVVPVVPAGVPLASAYPPGTPLAELLALPVVAGALRSLVGPSPRFDHHYVHAVAPAARLEAAGYRAAAQLTHQDGTIDTRRAFDVQLMYFPHEVTREMGGTRFVPGTHLRVVSENAIARYHNVRGQQHVVCPAGTVFFLHHGIWHGGGLNRTDRVRYMFKLRVNPTVRQRRLWDTSDLTDADFAPRPIFWTRPGDAREGPTAILMRSEPWFEDDTGRLELLNRIRLWRYLLGDETVDVDYWLTRIENEPSSRPEG